MKEYRKHFSDILMAGGLGLIIGAVFQLGVSSKPLSWLMGATLLIASYIVLRTEDK